MQLLQAIIETVLGDNEFKTDKAIDSILGQEYMKNPVAFMRRARHCTQFYRLQQWTPELHYVCPSELKTEAKLLLLVHHRLAITSIPPITNQLPKELLHLIINFLVRKFTNTT